MPSRFTHAARQADTDAVSRVIAYYFESFCFARILYGGAQNKTTSHCWSTCQHYGHYIQEGQHPLTGQRAANFRLLANQWAERRLVTQWSHGCRAMRRSVCNAVASNAGRSLCVQISRERSYPLLIYWYHSKGGGLRYNSAAESFYITKLCSRLFVLYCGNCPKDDKFRYFIPILRKLGAA